MSGNGFVEMLLQAGPPMIKIDDQNSIGNERCGSHEAHEADVEPETRSGDQERIADYQSTGGAVGHKHQHNQEHEGIERAPDKTG